MKFDELTKLRNMDLENIFLAGSAPVPGALAGFEFKGWNIPWFTRVAGIQKFIKGFFSGPDGRIEGYNIPVRQDGLKDAWTHLPNADEPKRFGFYLVGAVRPESRDNVYPNALLLDYGASPRNAFWRPERVLRDYLVQPDPAEPTVLLGKAYLALGARIASNFFVLERLRSTRWTP